MEDKIKELVKKVDELEKRIYELEKKGEYKSVYLDGSPNYVKEHYAKISKEREQAMYAEAREE